jgi:predicted dehydrogenase
MCSDAAFGKPVFVDKPFALDVSEASEMIAASRQYGLPVMSCSALR